MNRTNVVKLHLVRQIPVMQLSADTGEQIVRRYATRYWVDQRRKQPIRYAQGFPKTEDGSMEGAGRLILKGWISKAQCYDRVLGKVLWTLKRGPKLPGTNIHTVLPFKGDPDA